MVMNCMKVIAVFCYFAKVNASAIVKGRIIKKTKYIGKFILTIINLTSLLLPVTVKL